MRTRAPLMAAAVVLSSGILVAQASLVLDQSSPTETPPAPFTIAVGGPVSQVVSQTVTAGISGRLRAVEVPLGCASGQVILEIRDVDASGQPGPTVHFSDTYDFDDFPEIVTDTFRRLRLHGPPVTFAAGDRFAISLSNPTGSCGLWPGPAGDPYAGGQGWADASDGPIVPLSGNGTDDIPFRTFIQ